MELKKGTLLQNGKYVIEKTLGKGSFGITYLATVNMTTESDLGEIEVLAKVAIKEFFMSDVNNRNMDGSTVDGSTGSIFLNYKRRFRKEAENLSKLNHRNIVKVFEVFDENNTTYYVMEYLGETNLNRYINLKNGLNEEECKMFTVDIGEALQYMHDSLMIHLDLKPGNIMIRNDEAVLIDFGLSKQFKSDRQPETSTTIGLGTLGYAPIEQQNYNWKDHSGLPYTIDVYALGATMFKMVTGKTPPGASDVLNIGFPDDEINRSTVSEQLKEIIKKAMSPVTKNRYPSVSELLLKLDYKRNRKLEGAEAKLAIGSVIQSPRGFEYVVDAVKGIGDYYFTYMCHLTMVR